MAIERTADFVVVGAGAAGCVIARRLHDAGAEVLVLEAGREFEAGDERVSDPRRLGELRGTVYDWGFRTVPQRNIGGRILEWPQGFGVGGSSSINGLVWIRGTPQDYDAWADAGNPGWSYRDLLPIFKRIEDFEGGADDYRGVGGPIPVTNRYERGPIHQAVLDAYAELGIPFNDDHNGAEILGAGWCQFNMRAGRRVSAANAYLEPALGRPGFEVVTSAAIRRLLLERGRCVGVEWESGGLVSRAHARAEVIVSAGTIGSPKLLLLSGIGPAEELAGAGVEAFVDLPGVGRNLLDHVNAPLLFATQRAIDPPPAGVSPMQTNVFINTDPALRVPDVQAPSIALLPDYPGLEHDSENGFVVPVTNLRTVSRGQLRLASADPAAMPLIDPATYEAPDELASILAGMRLLRGLAHTDSLQRWGVREMHPGPGVDDDAQLEAYARQVSTSASHPVGTCKMGVDAEAVVDPRLRVHGVEGLRVADASIMPSIVSGNTHAPSLAIGERAADIILADHGSGNWTPDALATV